MGIDIAGPTVGSPAGMAYAHALSRAALPLIDLFQIGYAAGRLQDLYIPVGFDCHSRRVVASVLQPLQGVKEYGPGPLVSDIGHNSAHQPITLLSLSIWPRIAQPESMRAPLPTTVPA